MIKSEYYKLTGTNTNTATIYRVQTGAFSRKENADRLALELNTKGIDTYVVRIDNLYKVQCGAYSNKQNAINMSNRLKSMGYSNFIPGLDLSVVRLATKGEIIYVVDTVNGFLKLNDGTYLKQGFADKV